MDSVGPMSRLVAMGASTTGGGGAIAFERTGEGWYFERHLVVEGVRCYEVGNNCDTCAFWFTRTAVASGYEEYTDVRDELRRGVEDVDSPLVGALTAALPPGRYLPMLLDVQPRLVRPWDPGDYFSEERTALWEIPTYWGLPHNCSGHYYRAGTRAVDVRRPMDLAHLFEFVVPLTSVGMLDAETVDEYAAGDGLATAVAVSVLDVKQPATWDGDPDPNMHWCLPHYLVDGHHKVAAAAAAGGPVRLLSYLALDEGCSTEEDRAKVADLLRD